MKTRFLMIQHEKFGTLKKKILDMILHSSTSPSSETYTLTSLTRCLCEAAYASTWMDSLPHNHLPHTLHPAFLHSSPVSLRMAESFKHHASKQGNAVILWFIIIRYLILGRI